jgi:hypothetical protein
MSVHLWSATESNQRTWQKEGEPIPMQYPDGRGSSVTILGALGTHIPGYIFFHTLTSTNMVDCSNFLVSLHAKLPRQEPGAPARVIVIDNHAAHKSHLFQGTAIGHNFHLHFFPPASC